MIGVGRMGRRHLQVAHTMGLDVVGVCDQSRESLTLAEHENGIASEKHFTEPLALLQQTRPECVIIATTAPAHCALTCMAAEAGVKYILCEKPMAVSLAECDRMIATCKVHGAHLAINHYMRFLEFCTLPQSVIESESFGGLTSMTVVTGNIGLAMVGSHYLELFRFLVKDGFAEVCAWLNAERLPNPRGLQFEDRAGDLRVATTAGRRFYLEAGADQGHGIKVVYAGPYGQLVVDPFAGTMRVSLREAANRDLPTTRYVTPSVERTEHFTALDILLGAQRVLKALFEGEAYPSGEDGRAAILSLIAAHFSDESGHRPVRLAEEILPVERTFAWA